jgi:hypothetical protein
MDEQDALFTSPAKHEPWNKGTRTGLNRSVIDTPNMRPYTHDVKRESLGGACVVSLSEGKLCRKGLHRWQPAVNLQRLGVAGTEFGSCC